MDWSPLRWAVRTPSDTAGFDADTMLTLQLYLNDVPLEAGGQTAFLHDLQERRVSFEPRAGSALLPPHNLLHEGSLLGAGHKHTMRTDDMYQREMPKAFG